jgi:hypothetical protein
MKENIIIVRDKLERDEQLDYFGDMKARNFINNSIGKSYDPEYKKLFKWWTSLYKKDKQKAELIRLMYIDLLIITLKP